MIRTLKIFVTVSIFLISTAFAAESINAASVDISKTFQSVPQGKMYLDALLKKNNVEQKSQNFKAQQESLQTDVNRFSRDKTTLSATQIASTKKNLDTRKNNLVQEYKTINADNQKYQQEALEHFSGALMQSVKTIAEEKKYNLVLRGETVYLSQDITDDVISDMKKLN